MQSADVTFDLPAGTALESDARFWELYDSAFPSTERDPHEVVRATARQDTGFVVRACLAKQTVGLACVHMLREPAVPFLVYLAVAPEQRSRRLGSALFERAWEAARDRYGVLARDPKGFVWEVEIPDAARNERERQERQRRISFFERLGGRICAGSYLQPPIDRITPVPMHLMYRPAEGSPAPDERQINDLVRAMYFEKYDALNGIARRTLEDLLLRTGRP